MPEEREESAATRVLIVDDDPALRALIEEVLRLDGYQVEAAADGKAALERVAHAPPDLVLLDVEMPGLGGWEVLRRIKSDTLLRHLPVVMLTSQAEAGSKVQGLDLGADDYVTKPFHVAEFLARVRGVLRRTRRDLEANPLSRLPGNVSIEREIAARLASGARFAVLYADLNNFKAFNDRYGFRRGDALIRETARVLLETRAPGDFVGHIGGDDFIVVTAADSAETFCRKAIAAFDAAAPSHYDAEDRARGGIEVKGRQGRVARFPLAGLAIGGVSNARRPLESVGQISALGAEMKLFAKRSGSSAFAFDRRTE